MQRTAPTGQGKREINPELVRAVAQHEKRRVEEILSDPNVGLEEINWQDSLGWTPLTYAAFYGDFDLIKQLLHRGANVNHLSVSRKGSTADGTTPLHACAVMKFQSQVARDHYFESARILLLSGGNPYQENSSGLTPIEVAANQNNISMKLLLGGCALFKGTLAFQIPKMLGEKNRDRYCVVEPRYPWQVDTQAGTSLSRGRPSFAMLCYKGVEEPAPVTVIPLDNARVVVETGIATETGVLFVKTSPKLLKNIALKEVQRNQCVIGVKARPSPSLPASSVMQTLVEVLKTLNAAAVTDSLGQLCEAGMSQALHNQGLVKCMASEEETSAAGSSRGIRKSTPFPTSIPEETEHGQLRRKSLSLSAIRKTFMRRLSLSDKPRQQSLATSREAVETPRVPRISEETPETAGRMPDRKHRKSLSIFSRRKSVQEARTLDQSTAQREHANTATKIVSDMSNRTSVPLAFFGPYREELLQRFGLDRRQNSSSQLPLELATSPARNSMDVGDLDEPLEPMPAQIQKPPLALRQYSSGSEAAPRSGTVRDWVQQAAVRPDEGYQDMDISNSSRSGPERSVVAGSLLQQPSSLKSLDSGAQREDDGVPIESSHDPLAKKTSRSLSRKRSLRKRSEPGQASDSISPQVSSNSRSEGQDVAETPVPVFNAEEVMARLARHPPDSRLSVHSRSERPRSSVKAPRPAQSSSFSNKEMFGCSCQAEELFQWSLRPERHTRGFTPPPKFVRRKLEVEKEVATPVAAPVLPAHLPVDPLDAATSTEEVRLDETLSEENLAELIRSGWRRQADEPVQTDIKPSRSLQTSSKFAIPSLSAKLGAEHYRESHQPLEAHISANGSASAFSDGPAKVEELPLHDSEISRGRALNQSEVMYETQSTDD